MTLNTSSYYDQGYQAASEDFAKAPYHIEYVKHVHLDANSSEQSADYHSPVSGGCFTQPVYKAHIHSGYASVHGNCYTAPVYRAHSHTSNCYTTVNTSCQCGAYAGHWYNDTVFRCEVCGHGGHGPGGTCGAGITSTQLTCGKTAGTRYASEGLEGYSLTCTKTAGTRYADEGIEYYALSCGKTNDSIDNAYLAKGAPDSYVDETNPWYQAGFSKGKKHIVNMKGKYRSFSGFSFSNVTYSNTGQDYNNTWTCEVPLDWNDGPLMNWSFREGCWSGQTSYSYEGSWLYQCDYSVTLDNGVKVTSGSFVCTSSSNAAQPSMTMNTHQFNVFDYNTEGATKFILKVTVSSHVQGGTGKYSQAGNGATLDNIQAYYLQDAN